jgi:hypothetical protein
MGDCKRIRKHLWLALALPLAGTGCVREGMTSGETPPKTPPPTTTAAAPDAAAPAATADVEPPGPGPNTMHMPSCPSGRFCTTAKQAKQLAAAGSPLEEGCAHDLRDAPTPRPEGVPAAGPLSVSFDDAMTRQKRAENSPADACCYHWVMPCPGGRPLFEGDAARVAPLRAGAEWARGAISTPAAMRATQSARARALPAPLRARVAEAWLADALAEHASIAAFARATAELMAVGAPPDLLTAHVHAAADEVRHAERCFALAARYAGSPSAPGPLPAAMPRGSGLTGLARDTFLEGCVGETIASLSVARALAGCLDAEVAAVLRGIGDDEERHAALAWRTLSWTLAEGGAPVAESLRRTWHELRAKDAAAAVVTPDTAEDSSMLAAHGRLDRSAERRVRADALESIIAPTLMAVLAQAPRVTSAG